MSKTEDCEALNVFKVIKISFWIGYLVIEILPRYQLPCLALAEKITVSTLSSPGCLFLEVIDLNLWLILRFESMNETEMKRSCLLFYFAPKWFFYGKPHGTALHHYQPFWAFVFHRQNKLEPQSGFSYTLFSLNLKIATMTGSIQDAA